MFERTHIGLDVHAQSIVACALNPATGEIARAKMNADPVAVLDWIQKQETGSKVVYEAGPTGFGLARFLREHDIDCVIAAPSKLLKAPGEHVKTDKRDALTLARILSLGQITEVRVPTPEQEALRDLSRARQQASKELAHSRQRINAFTLRHGLYYPEKSRWTQDHLDWLRKQHFEEAAARQALEADLELEVTLLAHLKRLEALIAEHAQDCEYAGVIDALKCFRGIDTTTAYGLAVEIGDWTRFSGSSIGSYLGLVPSEHSSGTTRSQGSITRAGNTYARRLLVEAAWQHDRPYTRPGARLMKQFELVDSATRLRAMEGNHRLHRVWENFTQRGKKRTKANTAVARELAGWCWSVAAPLQEQAARTPIFSGAAIDAA
ncbi:IS110 family transposase [Paeniglutamicibacter cryotolerans]|uniref:Transposase n=1 Tax=Paeniglutamicibacter cryotolerans TaxID=670079 RepID=A0A839QMT8_9MICC|nr:IS110 family transposase [Paeniglutamicibacter cryotolerans]MBB2997090.1 transposase [Paeniglutamicibacter cryotolerans]